MNRVSMRMVVDRDETPDPKEWKPPLDRRAVLKIFGSGAAGALVLGCGSGGTAASGLTATSLSVGSSAASVMVGVAMTLTVMIAPSGATGSVTFYNGTTSLGVATFSSGQGQLAVSFAAAQTASITAVYAGDGTYAGCTSAAISVSVASVGTVGTTTSLSVSTTATTVGAPVTLTARVTPTAATGSVTFLNGTTVLGTGSLSAGLATLSIALPSAETETLTAVYGGSTTYAGSTSSAVSVAVTAASSAACGSAINAVTEGPYWLTDSASGYNRSDVRSDIAGTNTQTGTLLVLNLYVYDRNKSCVAMSGVQVDIWHCNAAGIYSGIRSSTNGNGVDYTSQSWLRGYQLTDSSGKVSFTTIVPGWYTGRTTHMHIRFRSTYDTSSDGSTNTAQLFFDQTFIDTFDTSISPYTSEGKNSVKNAGDSIYTSEGGTTLLSLSGSSAVGYTATFSVYLPLS